MSSDPLPQIKLTHDDNLVIYTRGETTLVLCRSAFSLTPSTASIKTRRLVVYADTIFVGGHVECRGKELRLHCNTLQWGDDAFLDFKGIDGDKVAAIAPQPLSDGQIGGDIKIHVHCLPLRLVNGKAAFFTQNFKADVSGGDAGSSHKDAKSIEWVAGKLGEPGKVTLYYSNPLFRASASLLEIYSATDSLPKKLRMIQAHVIPTLEENGSTVLSLEDKVPIFKSHVSDLLKLHETLSRCVDLIIIQNLPDGDIKADLNGISRMIGSLLSSQDYSIAVPEINQPAADLSLLLGNMAQLSGGQTPEAQARLRAIIGSFKSCKAAVDAKLQTSKSFPATTLSTQINQIWGDILNAHDVAAGYFKMHVKPSQSVDSVQVSYTSSGKDDLSVEIPLVHPDQCQMMLRNIDAAFFSNNTISAKEGYQNLFERLRFVPALLEQERNIAKGETQDMSALSKAFHNMETAEGLSLWTFDMLANLYSQVCGRLDQLNMNLDLFGLSATSAPRLSYDYHSQYARVQIDRLGGYEKSYWNFFDVHQDQMEAGSVLQEARAINVYRRKEADDEIKRALTAITAKEAEIEKAASDIATKRDKLHESLQTVRAELDSWQWPSIGTTIAAVASVVVIGAFLVSNPAGWATAAMALAAGSQQFGSLKDEMCDTIKDTNGQSINKKYLLNELSSCEDDLGSLLKVAYTMQSDGSRSVNDSDTQKIAVTEAQLTKFLKQFKDKLPKDKAEDLSNMLKDFVDVSKARNQDILAYNNAVISLYQQIKNKSLTQKQAEKIGSELIKQNVGLPSIVAYYQRLRNDSRISILRAVKQSALALRFWGLRATTKFNLPSLLSNVDELEAHLGVLQQEYELSISRFGSFSQSVWPRAVAEPGIFYPLSDAERNGLKLGIPDANGDNVYSVQIEGLAASVTRATTLTQSPFAGHSNVRISQVRAWLPGIVVTGPSRRLIVELVHEGKESITDPDDVNFAFEHAPIYLTFQYDWQRVKKREDIRHEAETARQVLPSDWMSGNANARVQAPFGPFSTWRITLREAINGKLDLDKVDGVYLEFSGSSFPFRT